jgi:hypothetical protein
MMDQLVIQVAIVHLLDVDVVQTIFVLFLNQLVEVALHQLKIHELRYLVLACTMRVSELV